MDRTPSGVLPYPGLRPFRADEADIFFGRERQTDELLVKLQSHRFIAVTGPSGCGKSSLVKAGLIPALRAGFMLTAGSRWRFCEVRPGQHPILSLANGLTSVLGEPPEERPFVEAALRFGPLGLVQVVRESPLFRDASLLVLVDQFEEIFRFRERIDPDEADAFVRLLLSSAATIDVPVYIVITMRSDYLGDCALFHGLPEAINAGQYLTPRLTREQCASAIVGPAQVCGGTVDAALVNRLLNDFGPDPDQLPLLQHALMRMWVRELGQLSSGQITSLNLTTEDYEAVGGLAHALARHADEALSEVPPAQRHLAEVLFRRLTERGAGRRDTRAPARLGEVAAIAGARIADQAAVVNVFRGDGRHFVTAPDGDLTAETLLDIGHESLIRQWGTLAAWVEDEAESATTYKRLVDFGHLWKKNAAGLWRPPELEQALAWKHTQRPNAAWAVRYSSGNDFDVAMEFLKASEREWEAEQARAAQWEEEERRRERERIEQEAQRERLEAVAKAAHAEAELERTRAAAEIQRRRNRALRVATVLLSIGVIGLLAYTFRYRYLWVWEHTDYYNTYVKRFGVPSGVGTPLTEAQVRGRDFTLKVVRRGVRGPVIRMEAVDGNGRFAMGASSATAYLSDSGDVAERGRTVKWEYVYGNDGEIAYEVELDARGRQVASMVYMPAGSDKRQRTAHFFGPGGERLAPGQSCADYVQVEFSGEGYEQRVRYMARGRPAFGRDRALQAQFRYDDRGNATEMISLDGNGKPMTDLFGNAAVKMRHDALGNTLEATLHDEQGVLTPGREGWSIKRYEYDDNGLHRQTALFDEANRPTLHQEGWHRFAQERDSNGQVIGEQYWGINGEPAVIKGCHAYRSDRDERGRLKTTRCVGVTGEPQSESSLGVAAWRRAYDDDDNIVEWTYFDAKGAPINNSDGYHRSTVKHDDRGHAVGFEYFGLDGKSVRRKEGYAALAIEFQGDKEIRRVYLDVDRRPVLVKDYGYAERRLEYDRSGNLILTAYYDAAGQPQAQSAGYVAQRNVHDECGQVIERWYLGPDRNPLVMPTLKYAGVRYARDRLGREIRTTFLSEKGTPTLTTGGVAGRVNDYDSSGNTTEERYFGIDGRPTLYERQYSARRMTYDRRGNLTREEFLGLDGKPAIDRQIRLITSAFDTQNQLVERSYSYYKVGTHTPLGTIKMTYNDRNQKVDEAYFGPDGRPLLYPTAHGDCIRLHFVYDANGRPTAQCIDERGEARKTS